MPWIKDQMEILGQQITKIAKIWEETGISDIQVVERQCAFEGHLNNLLNLMIEEETKRKESILKNNADLKKAINCIEREMGSTETSFEHLKSFSLLKIFEHLTHLKNELDSKTDCLRKQYKELQKEESTLAEMLCMPIPERNVFKYVPDVKSIRECKQNVEFMSKEKLNRQSKINSLIQLINPLKVRLEEDTLLAQNVSIDIESIEKIRSELERCQKSINELEDNCNQKFELFETLSKRLELNPTTYKLPEQCSKQNLLELNGHVLRLRALRLENLPLCIENCRQQIRDIWKKCHISHDEKNKFLPYLESCSISEELLEIHEDEFHRWSSFLSENEEFFKAFNKLNDLNNQLKASEMKLKDPIVLKNRGGILLKVEKELKLLKQKEIPKAEKCLLSNLNKVDSSLEWKSIRLYEMSVSDYIEQIHHFEKESISDTASKRTLNDTLIVSSQKPKLQRMDACYSPSISSKRS